jgi:predicted membrane-bound mannosyltransferase
MTLVYSLIPYKTPWCLLGFWHGFILMAGFGASTLLRTLHRPWLQVPAIAVLLALCAQLGRQAWSSSLEERFVTDRRNPYVYAHPTKDVVRAGERINELAALHSDKNKMLIAVVGEEYWPLPWYLRGMQQVGYVSPEQFAAQPQLLQAPVIIASPEAAEKVLQLLGPDIEKRYTSEAYSLRPAVVASVFIERKLWDAYLKNRAATTP